MDKEFTNFSLALCVRIIVFNASVYLKKILNFDFFTKGNFHIMTFNVAPYNLIGCCPCTDETYCPVLCKHLTLAAVDSFKCSTLSTRYRRPKMASSECKVSYRHT